MESNRGEVFFQMWFRKRENCNRSFMSSPFLKKKTKREGGGGGRWNIAFFSYSEELGAGRGSIESLNIRGP